MNDSPIRRLIEASSLSTPGARALRDTVSDETARRIVARSEQSAVGWETFLDDVQTQLDQAGCEVQLAASLADGTAEVALPDGGVVRFDAGMVAGLTASEVAQRIASRAESGCIPLLREGEPRRGANPTVNTWPPAGA